MSYNHDTYLFSFDEDDFEPLENPNLDPINQKKTISAIAIYHGLGEICIQRGYGKPRTYRYSWHRCAMVRRTVMSLYLYSAFSVVDYEIYRIEGLIK